MLQGVGDDRREWREWSGVAYHLRRRLTDEEQVAIGEAIDLRGKPEARIRAVKMGMFLNRVPNELVQHEING